MVGVIGVTALSFSYPPGVVIRRDVLELPLVAQGQALRSNPTHSPVVGVHVLACREYPQNLVTRPFGIGGWRGLMRRRKS